MEDQAPATGVARRIPGRRLVVASVASVAAVALGVAMVAGVSANGGPGGPGGPGRFGGGRGGVTITAVNGNQLTLSTDDGWTRTVDASGVTVKNGDATITLADLKAGAEIALVQSRNFDGSVTVTEIDVVAPHVEGTVTAIDATSLTIRQDDGTTKTVTLTDTTTYNVNGGSSTRDGVTVGSEAHVQGTASADGTFTATSVSTHPANIGGTVSATAADSITITDASGATATIKVSASTAYQNANGTATLADVTVGSIVRAEGTRNADGSLTATVVRIGTADGGFGGPAGFGGPRGGHGRGPGGPGGQNGGNGAPGIPTTPVTPSVSPSA